MKVGREEQDVIVQMARVEGEYGVTVRDCPLVDDDLGRELSRLEIVAIEQGLELVARPCFRGRPMRQRDMHHRQSRLEVKGGR